MHELIKLLQPLAAQADFSKLYWLNNGENDLERFYCNTCANKRVVELIIDYPEIEICYPISALEMDYLPTCHLCNRPLEISLLSEGAITILDYFLEDIESDQDIDIDQYPHDAYDLLKVLYSLDVNHLDFNRQSKLSLLIDKYTKALSNRGTENG